MPPTIPYVNGLKFCSRCQEYQEPSSFTRDKNRVDGLYTYCKDCTRVQAKAYYHDPKNGRKLKDRERFLRNRYDMSLSDWDTLFLAQDSRCAVCKTDEPNDIYDRWHTDHDHVTKKVRGILCAKCNLAVGFVENGWTLIVPEIEKYLESHSNGGGGRGALVNQEAG